MAVALAEMHVAPPVVSPAVAVVAVAAAVEVVAAEAAVVAVVSMLLHLELVLDVLRPAAVMLSEVAAPVGTSVGPPSTVGRTAWVVSPVQSEGVV